MTGKELGKEKNKIFEEAKKVLEGNWIELEDGEGYTRPAEGIYPLQWNLDSSFAAYGYSHYDVPRAIIELRSLFKGQWSNGFLPHIIFHKKVEHYFPNEDFWDSKNVTDKSPRDVGTSGISQPPIVAIGRSVAQHSIRIQKRYRDEKSGEWKTTTYFRPDELPKLALVVSKTYEHLMLRETDDTRSAPAS